MQPRVAPDLHFHTFYEDPVGRKSARSNAFKDALAVVTVATLCVALWLLWGAGFFRPGGLYPDVEDLNRIGGFLAGVLAPVVLAWAARGYYLQRRQILQSLAATRRQIALQLKANDLSRRDLELQKELRDAAVRSEDLRTAPRFVVRDEGVTCGTRRLVIGALDFQGLGNAQVRLEYGLIATQAIALGIRVRMTCLAPEPVQVVAFDHPGSLLEVGQKHGVSIDFPQHRFAELNELPLVCEVEARRADGRVTYQRWVSPYDWVSFAEDAFYPVDEAGSFDNGLAACVRIGDAA
ncbi:hypothetical protein DWG18_06850 [Lysobacter sp. TY2-98]|uniref:hypothetical protein n=1 Tax=Lysobacter sp. TY2-98 TaxID=2290922 RepID=UPI000E200BAD|nr:hypothetical protein [Lysobacter sp. TY2-98]AXK72026.1 hypothetical protein DWG18_06850 [Lysobacter sp. TY2-98]